MKKLKLFTTLALTSCVVSCTQVPAGYRGVIVNLYGSDKGVSERVVDTGRYWLGFSQELFLFPIFLQNYTWVEDEKITMQTSEGMTISTDVGITYSIPPDNIAKVFQKYRLGVDEITKTFLHNMVRDAMNKVSSTMTIEQLYSDRKEEFISKVNEIVKTEGLKDGIEIEKIYLVGSFEIPQTVMASINSKIQATQDAMRVNNEIATTRAEAEKTIIEAKARAERTRIDSEATAIANRIISESLSDEFIQYQLAQKWDGKLPQVATDKIIPMITLDSK